MRYRLEIYDANKSHDLTLYFENGVNRNFIAKTIKENKNRFQGDVKSYVVDTTINKKVFAAFFPETSLV